MKMMLIAAAALLITGSAAAQSPTDKPQACWLETSAATMDGAMGGAGLRDTKVWDSTVSGVLVRHAKGDVLIDTAFGPNAEAQMNELPDAARAFGLQIIAGAKDRKPILDVLATLFPSKTRPTKITSRRKNNPKNAWRRSDGRPAEGTPGRRLDFLRSSNNERHQNIPGPRR